MRLGALAEAFRREDGPAEVLSLCAAGQYGWDGVAPNLEGVLHPKCVETCARDGDPGTPALDPICRFTETAPGEPPRDLPRCQELLGEWRPPDGADACFAVRVDRDGKATPSQLDDMTPECEGPGYSAEFVVIRTTPRVDGLCFAGGCEPSDDPARDCPYR